MKLKELEKIVENMRKHPCYALLSLARTGSTAIQTALDSHPNMTWLAEIWAPASQPATTYGWTVGQRLQRSWMLPRRGFSITTGPRNMDGPLLPGVWNVAVPYVHYTDKPKFRRLNDALKDTIWPIIQRMEGHAKIIRLGRHNQIACCVSWLHANEVGIWHIRKKTKGSAARLRRKPPVKIDLAQLDKRLKYIEDHWNSLQETFPDALEVYYEDLVLTPRKLYAKIFDYLGVKRHSVVSAVAKNTTPWYKRVANWAELREHYRGNAKYEHCFEETD